MTATANLPIDLDAPAPEDGLFGLCLVLRPALLRLEVPRDLAEYDAHLDEMLPTLEGLLGIARKTADGAGFGDQTKPVRLEETITGFLHRLELACATAETRVRGFVAELSAAKNVDATQQAGVSTKLTRMADVLLELRTLLQDLRWAVMEHNANLETPSGETFDSAEALIASLNR